MHTCSYKKHRHINRILQFQIVSHKTKIDLHSSLALIISTHYLSFIHQESHFEHSHGHTNKFHFKIQFEVFSHRNIL